MPTSFPTSEIPTLRAVRQATPVLLVMSRLNRPAGETEIAEILGVSPLTTRTHLRSLERFGLVNRITFHNGWVLTEGGRLFILPPVPPRQAGSGGPEPDRITAEPKNEQPCIMPQAENIAPCEPVNFYPQSERITYSGPVEFEFRFENTSFSSPVNFAYQPENLPLEPESQLKETQSLKKESLTLLKRELKTPSLKDSDSDSETNRKNDSQPDKTAILAAAEELFGEPILLSNFDQQMLLAWIAQIYQRRSHCQHPSRVVYSNIMRGEPPQELYLESPCKYLPDSFLIRAGLLDPPAEEADNTGDLVWEDALSDPEPDESCFLKLNARGLTPLDAWDMVQDQLKEEMVYVIGNYRTHVEPTWLARYDDGLGEFTLVAPTETSRLWLADRLTSLAQRKLLGICNREVRVVFCLDEELESSV